ncbi:MAG TPA: DUF4238 domain-containing protein [Terriglobales bacterium]|nr:DUF4238 domain-containing protein [Terriglobales bacterium]
MIGSHTIPVFYLQQFANKSPLRKKHGLIWVYEKGKVPQERSLRVQGKQKGYFAVLRDDRSMDDAASEQAITDLENECNDVLFCSKSELFDWSSSTHRRKLAFYIAFLYSRATQRRAHSEKIGLNIYEELSMAADDGKLMQELADAVNKAAGKKALTADSMREITLGRVSQGKTAAEMNTDFVSNLRSLTDHLAGFLIQKHWQVWRAPEGMEFVSSDNPVMNFIPLPHGPFHPGHGFNTAGAHTAFPLAPGKCLIIGVPVGSAESRRVEAETVTRTNEALISICDKYVYSKTRSDQVQALTQQYAGAFRYGINSLVPIGMKLPSVRGLLRQWYGLDPNEN